MPIDRRTFLKRIGGGLLAVAAAPLIVPTSAPLFIPSDRLEMGVPKALAQTLASGRPPAEPMRGAVPMRLNQDEFSLEWGGRLPAGSVVTVDEVTARRWIDNRIGAPTESWMRSASAAEQRAVVAQAVPDPWRFRTAPQPSGPGYRTRVEDGGWFREAALLHADDPPSITILDDLPEDEYAPV